MVGNGWGVVGFDKLLVISAAGVAHGIFLLSRKGRNHEYMSLSSPSCWYESQAHNVNSVLHTASGMAQR